MRSDFEECVLRVQLIQTEMIGDDDGNVDADFDKSDWQAEAEAADDFDRGVLAGIYIEALREAKYDSCDFEVRKIKFDSSIFFRRIFFLFF